MPAPYSGKCLCGGVRLTVKSEPVTVLSCFCVHCSKGAGGCNQLVGLLQLNEVWERAYAHNCRLPNSQPRTSISQLSRVRFPSTLLRTLLAVLPRKRPFARPVVFLSGLSLLLPRASTCSSARAFWRAGKFRESFLRPVAKLTIRQTL